MVIGTNTGTITDVDGRFSFDVPSSSQLRLQVSYLGYTPVIIELSQENNYDIILEEDNNLMDEVVVVGYGVQKKSVVTAAISKVTTDDIDKAIPTRVDNVLKGKVSGVTITGGSGQPGSGSVVRIRGIGTINNSEPLYLVDGMAVGSIDYLNPTDIESVEVLKDAASAAIYGARAANGVILVSTKAGKKGRARISYDVNFGWQNPWKKRAVLDAPWYQTIMNESSINAGRAPIYGTITTDKGTDWQDEVFNYDAPVQSHQVSINGGSDNSTYFISLGYLNQEGIVGGNFNRSNYNRWSARINNTYTVFDDSKEHKLFNKLVVGANIGYSRTKSTGINENTLFYSPLGSALLVDPSMPLYAVNPEEVLQQHPTAVTDKNGRVYSIPDPSFNEIINPVANMQLPAGWNKADRLVGTVWGELSLFDGLTFKSSYGMDLDSGTYDSWSYPYYLSSGGAASSTNSSVSSDFSRGHSWQVENTLTYTKTFAKKHNLTLMLGQSASKYSYKNLSGTDYGLPLYDAHKATIDFATGDREDERVSGGRSYSTLASYFGRINYNFEERYMFQATIRRDGSSNFGPSNKWATFPSLSAGWNITNEKFMEDRPSWLTSLKLRTSWGKNGNQNIAQFGYLSTVSYGKNYTLGNGDSETITSGATLAGLSNPQLKWEESEQFDIGLEMGFLSNALTVNIDYFNKKTIGMLINIPIPSYIGTAAPLGNVGDMKNSGFELDLSYKFRVSDVNIGFSGNVSYLKNKLVKLGNESGYLNFDSVQGVGTVSRGENGEEYPFFYGHKTNGIFQTQSQVDSYVNSSGQLLQPNAVPGDVIFVDTNEDGSIDDDDRVKIGKGTPDFTFGFSLNAEWKGFDMNAFFQGVSGNDVFDATRRVDLVYTNQPAWILDRWTGPGTSNKIPRVTITDNNNNWRSSDLYVKNGAYLRLKTIQLGYTIPKKIVQKARFQKVRFYVAGENLLTFTGYDGFDPEIGTGGTSLGIDMGAYPQSRTISVGANITF